jgi:putative membrane protein
MRTSVQTSILMLALSGLMALPAAFPRVATAADDSSGGSVADKAWSAGESAKDAATNAGSAVKDSTKNAAGYIADTAKDAGARVTGGKDTLFVREAAIGGLSEVKSAELAKSKASSAQVKSFAEQMIKDHMKANQELEQLAKQKGIQLPTALNNEEQTNLDKLSKLSGGAFDKAYVMQQQTGHEQMLRLMEDEAQNGKDPDLKRFAAKTKNVVSEHHARITKLGG